MRSTLMCIELMTILVTLQREIVLQIDIANLSVLLIVLDVLTALHKLQTSGLILWLSGLELRELLLQLLFA